MNAGVSTPVFVMKDIRSIDMDLAVEMQREMRLRDTIKRELEVCEDHIRQCLVKIATRATNVPEGFECTYVPGGRRVVLSAWVPQGIPDDFSEIGDCIGALVRMNPSSAEGPVMMKAEDFSADDFTLKDMD